MISLGRSKYYKLSVEYKTVRKNWFINLVYMPVVHKKARAGKKSMLCGLITHITNLVSIATLARILKKLVTYSYKLHSINDTIV